jgi:hypothetical protein
MALPQKMISVSKRIINNFVRRYVAELWEKMLKFFRIEKVLSPCSKRWKRRYSGY